MNKHYSEADLLETYYMQPGQSMPVMMHLAECSDCAARYERLERKLREAASCNTEKHETFWVRQRHTIMRSIAARRERSATAGRTWRAVAAVFLAFFLGGAVTYEIVKPKAPVAVTETATLAKQPAPAPVQKSDELLLHDPWQSDELRDFHGIVAWEKWEEPKQTTKGDDSL